MASQFQQRKHIVWTLKSSLPSVLFNLNIYDYPLVCNDLKQAVEILANRYCFKRCTVNEFCYGHTYIVQDLDYVPDINSFTYCYEYLGPLKSTFSPSIDPIWEWIASFLYNDSGFCQVNRKCLQLVLDWKAKRLKWTSFSAVKYLEPFLIKPELIQNWTLNSFSEFNTIPPNIKRLLCLILDDQHALWFSKYQSLTDLKLGSIPLWPSNVSLPPNLTKLEQFDINSSIIVSGFLPNSITELSFSCRELKLNQGCFPLDLKMLKLEWFSNEIGDAISNPNELCELDICHTDNEINLTHKNFSNISVLKITNYTFTKPFIVPPKVEKLVLSSINRVDFVIYPENSLPTLVFEKCTCNYASLQNFIPTTIQQLIGDMFNRDVDFLLLRLLQNNSFCGYSNLKVLSITFDKIFYKEQMNELKHLKKLQSIAFYIHSRYYYFDTHQKCKNFIQSLCLNESLLAF